MTILIIAEHDNNDIAPCVLNTIGAAKLIGGGEVHMLVVGYNCSPAAEKAAKISEISKVIKVDAPELEHQLAEDMAPLITDIADSYSHILAPASTFGKNLLPRAAALLDMQQISDIIGVESADSFLRLSLIHI